MSSDLNDEELLHLTSYAGDDAHFKTCDFCQAYRERISADVDLGVLGVLPRETFPEVELPPRILSKQIQLDHVYAPRSNEDAHCTVCGFNGFYHRIGRELRPGDRVHHGEPLAARTMNSILARLEECELRAGIWKA